MFKASHMAISAAMMMAFAVPSFANFDSATGTVTCTGYHLEFTGDVDSSSGASWTITYTFTLHPSTGSDIVVTDTVPIPSTGTFAPFDVTVTKNFTTPLGQMYTITSPSATLRVNGFTQETIPIVFTSNIVQCGGTGACPVTIGYWKHHNFPSPANSAGLTIGTTTYTSGELLNILSANGGDAVAILGRQLVGALLNQDEGAVDNPAADAAILTAETLISANNIDLLTSFVAPSSVLGQALIAQATTLNGYNNGNFNNCQ